MREIKFITTKDCSLCDEGLRKATLLFSNFFHINEIDVNTYDPNYIFRVPLVIYKEKILDEGDLSLRKLVMNFIWTSTIR